MVSAYKEMTLRIFHSINFIKQLEEFPEIPEDKKIDFKFTKPGYDKLLIFDLDETLIHTIRSEEELEEGEYTDLYGGKNICGEIVVELLEPGYDEPFLSEFLIRPFVKKCLEMVNEKFEVAVFTAGYDWYANPIIDIIDPDGDLIQHRFFR